jgi:nicotinamidase-related amidase
MNPELLRTLAEQVRSEHAAVIVIDPQKDFCASDGVMGRLFGLDMSPVQEAVPALNAFLTAARRAGVPVVWVREIFAPSRMLPNSRVINGDGDDLVLIREGGDGIDWYSGVTPPLPGEPIFTKYNYDAFDGTDLELWLRSRGIQTLVFTGFTTNVCVETSARHAYIRGFYVVTLADCTGAPSRPEHDAALLNLGKYFGQVASSDDVIACWTGALRPGPRHAVARSA